MESGRPCYEATFSPQDYGDLHVIQFYFFFDSNLRLGRFTDKIGAFINVAHHKDHASHIDSFFLSTKETVVVNAEFVHRIQEESFEQSKCVDNYIPQVYNFTGVPFETSYNQRSCHDLCFARKQFEICNCSAIVGWNITKTDCLEDELKRECIQNSSGSTEKFQLLFRGDVKSCLSKCVKKCDQKSLEFNVVKTEWDLQRANVDHIWEELEKMFRSLYTPQQLNQLFFESVPQNSAELVIHLKRTQMKRMETILPMSVSTFVSNLGGLIGMWLGLSAVSCLEFIEQLFAKLCLQNKDPM